MGGGLCQIKCPPPHTAAEEEEEEAPPPSPLGGEAKKVIASCQQSSLLRPRPTHAASLRSRPMGVRPTDPPTDLADPFPPSLLLQIPIAVHRPTEVELDNAAPLLCRWPPDVSEKRKELFFPLLRSDTHTHTPIPPPVVRSSDHKPPVPSFSSRGGWNPTFFLPPFLSPSSPFSSSTSVPFPLLAFISSPPPPSTFFPPTVDEQITGREKRQPGKGNVERRRRRRRESG